MNPANADPALGAQRCGSNHAHRHKADHCEGVDGNQKRPETLQRQPFQSQRQQHSEGRGDPVVIPVGIVRLALGAGDQHPCDGDHPERNTPEHPLPVRSAAVTSDEHRQTGWVTALSTVSARPLNSAALAESLRLITIGRPVSPPSCTGISMGI